MIGYCCICNFELDSFDGLNYCPNCGTSYPPLGVEDDVMLKINWQELRTLIIWAERWAGRGAKEFPDMLRFVYAAAKRLKTQCPERKGLTLTEEIEELREKYGEVETNLPSSPPERLSTNEVLEEVKEILKGDV